MSTYDTLYRQWQMLRLVPRYPQKASTQAIYKKLGDAGYLTTDRTVARDLDSLSTIFGYTCEEEGRAKLWFWPPDARMMDIPGMEPNLALAWMISRGYLEKALPPAALRHLVPYFARAKEVLESQRGLKQGRWARLFRVSRRGPGLSAVALDSDVYDAVCSALVDQQCLSVRYTARSTGETKSLELNPLALVLRHGAYYLVATAGEYEDPVHFALHRMRSAGLLTKPRRVPPGLDLDAYIERSFQYPVSPKTLALKLRVQPGVAELLVERTLGPDQIFGETESGQWVPVSVTADDTLELRWWLQGFGDQIIVDKPRSLKNEFRELAQRMAKNYAG